MSRSLVGNSVGFLLDRVFHRNTLTDGWNTTPTSMVKIVIRPSDKVKGLNLNFHREDTLYSERYVYACE